MEDNDRFVDELLNSALAHHRDAEPRPGLEGRILAHVRAASTMRATSRKRWVIGSAVAAAVVVMLATVYVERRPHGPLVETSRSLKAVPAPSPNQTLTANSEAVPKAGAETSTIATKRAAHHPRKPSRTIEAHHWPAQFPTPAPLTAEQKSLVRYVQQTPPEVLEQPIFKAGLTIQHVEIRPVEIPPVEITPSAFGPTREEINRLSE